MALGTIKWFNESKGFCFITTDERRDVMYIKTKSLETGLKSLLKER